MAPAPRHRSGLALYAHPLRLESHAARMIVREKALACELILVDEQTPSEDLAQLNPYNSTPTLVEREVVLYDTAVLGEYLDERYPHPPLMPSDPVSRAHIRLAIHRIRQHWYPLAETLLSDARGAERDRAKRRLREELLLAAPAFGAARFFLSNDLSMADCFLTPLLYRLPRLDLDLGRAGEDIRRYAEQMLHAPSLQRSLTDSERSLREVPM